MPDYVLIFPFLSVALINSAAFPIKFSSLFYCNGHVRKSKEQLIRSIILMHGHSRNQSGVMLASKALEEQGNRAVCVDYSKGGKIQAEA